MFFHTASASTAATLHKQTSRVLLELVLTGVNAQDGVSVGVQSGELHNLCHAPT